MPSRPSCARARGFTLIEMLVAITLLAILSLLAWRGLDAILLSRTRIAGDAEDVRAVLRALTQIERDVSEARAPTLGPPTSPLPPGVAVDATPGGLLVEIVRAAPDPEGGGPLQRVNYVVDRGRLLRAAGLPGTKLPLADPAGGVALLDAVAGLEVQAYVMGDQQGGRWLPLPLQGEMAPGTRVTGLRFTLTRDNGERFVRIVAR